MGLDTFSTRLKDLMELEGISKRALSIKIGVDRASIRLWLSGNYYPRCDALIKLSSFFKVSIDALVGLEEAVENAYIVVDEENAIEKARESFCIAVKEYMQKKKWTKYAFAKALNIDQKAFANWFLKGSVPETATIIKVAQTMKISIEELLGRKR